MRFLVAALAMMAIVAAPVRADDTWGTYTTAAYTTSAGGTTSVAGTTVGGTKGGSDSSTTYVYTTAAPGSTTAGGSGDTTTWAATTSAAGGESTTTLSGESTTTSSGESTTTSSGSGGESTTTVSGATTSSGESTTTSSGGSTSSGSGSTTTVAPGGSTTTAAGGSTTAAGGSTTVPPRGGSLAGDPVFSGFDGQSFQVHGVPGAVYNILSTPCLNMNAEFNLLRAPGRHSTLSTGKHKMHLERKAVMGKGVSYSEFLNNVATAGRAAGRAQLKAAGGQSLKLDGKRFTTRWTHSGTYVSEVGFSVNGVKALVAAGEWDHGFTSVMVDSRPVHVGEVAQLSPNADEIVDDTNAGAEWPANEHAFQNTLVRLSSHQVLITTPTIRVLLSNSDRFVNIDSISVNDASSSLVIDGLLGQTHPANGNMMASGGGKEEDKLAGSVAALRRQKLAQMQHAIAADASKINESDEPTQHDDLQAARNDVLYHLDDYHVKGDYLFGADFTENKYEPDTGKCL